LSKIEEFGAKADEEIRMKNAAKSNRLLFSLLYYKRHKKDEKFSRKNKIFELEKQRRRSPGKTDGNSRNSFLARC
jgi:hypothetical protein